MCETALFIAIVFLGVFIIKFPGPFGYAHIGDSMIFLSVLMLGGKRGAAAGGLGAAVADIVSGYTIWALPTFICKAIMALLMGFMIKRHAFGLKGRPLWIVSAAASGIAQGICYVLFWLLLFGRAAAIAAVPRPALPDCIRNHHRSCDFRSPAEDKLKKTLHLHN